MRTMARSVTWMPLAGGFGAAGPAAICMPAASAGCTGAFSVLSFTTSMIFPQIAKSPGALASGFHFDRLLLRLGGAVLLLPVTDRRTDGIFRQDRAVDLYRRQRELADDVRVLDRQRFIDRLALDPFGRERRRSDRGAATEGLELGVLDDAGILVHLDLQLHDVAALGRAHQASADFGAVLVERTNVPRICVVVQYLIAVCHFSDFS